MPVVVERVVVNPGSPRSAESPGLTLTLEESEDVTLSDGPFNIADEGSLDGALELDLHLGDTTS